MTNEELVALIRDGIDVPGDMLLLYDQNRGLIAKIARKYTAYEEMDDLMQEGYLGLYAAVCAYREEEGAAFVTYAGYWIRQAIHRYVEDCSSVVRISVHRQADLRRYKKMVCDFKKYYGREPSDRELRALLHISVENA